MGKTGLDDQLFWDNIMLACWSWEKLVLGKIGRDDNCFGIILCQSVGLGRNWSREKLVEMTIVLG